MTDKLAIVDSGLALLPPKMTSRAARVMLVAIGQQESGWATTVQYGGGPAHSFYQFESGGGCKGVLSHPASKALAEGLCARAGIEATPKALWTLMADPEKQDTATAMARLLLYTDAAALPPPVAESEQAAWDYYQRNWRPGKPDRKRWIGAWALACNLVPLNAAVT